MNSTPRPIRFIESMTRLLEERGWEVTVERTEDRYFISANGRRYDDFIAMSALLNPYSGRWNFSCASLHGKTYTTYAKAGAAIDSAARYGGRMEVTA